MSAATLLGTASSRAFRSTGIAACIASLVFLAGQADAGAAGIEQLRAFLGGAKNGQTTFRQVVLSKSGRAPKESSGTFAFARPGKFRWSYDKPHPQVIVGDGEKLWIYDPDLNQVIVKKLDGALGSTPAALLAGDDELENNFTIDQRRFQRRNRLRRCET